MDDSLERLEAECAECKRCSLCFGRTKLVFAAGNPESEIMLIGEGPGEQEDLQGVPFVGAAGKLLDDMLEMICLDRSKVYIANMVKCRPPHNRDPHDDELDACRRWLDRQIALIEPKIIICLGRVAAKGIIDSDFRITRDHGKWFDVGGAQCMAIYHPSALLRDLARRPETFADLREIRRVIKEKCSVY